MWKKRRAFSFATNLPLQGRIKEVNEWLGDEVIRFDPYLTDED